MLKATCKNTCTVPGRGYVEAGQIIDVESADLKKFPFLKHFSYDGPKAAAEKAAAEKAAAEKAAAEKAAAEKAAAEKATPAKKGTGKKAAADKKNDLTA